MKKKLILACCPIIIVLILSACSLPHRAFALNAETRLKYQGLCEQNPNPHHVWDDANTTCVCAKPYVQDDIESWACITQEEYTRKHTWNGSSSNTPTPKPVTETKPVTSTVPATTSASTYVGLPKDTFTISADNYADVNSDGSVSLTSTKTLNSIKDGATEAVYQEKLKAWRQSVEVAEQKGEFKDESSKQEFLNKAQEEKDIKLQIATAIKLLGFNHVRVLECTVKDFKFEYQSAEYRAYWKSPVNNNMFDDTTSAAAFNQVSKNASGYASQVGSLEARLKEEFSTDWKVKYLSVPAMPERPNQNQTSFSPYNG